MYTALNPLLTNALGIVNFLYCLAIYASYPQHMMHLHKRMKDEDHKTVKASKLVQIFF